MAKYQYRVAGYSTAFSSLEKARKWKRKKKLPRNTRIFRRLKRMEV